MFQQEQVRAMGKCEWHLDSFRSIYEIIFPKLQELIELTINEELNFKLKGYYQKYWQYKQIPTFQ